MRVTVTAGVVKADKRAVAIVSLQPRRVEAKYEVNILVTPTPVLIRKTINQADMCILQKDGPAEELHRIREKILLDERRLQSVPDQHRWLLGIAVVRPPWHIVDIMKAHIVDLVPQDLKTDIHQEPAIEREAWRLLDNEKAHIDGFVCLVTLKIRDRVRKKR